ncbi:MAG TPA: potassium channel protein [Thermodesulfobacteriaceae bacterium]|nr:potassium channel protein [Thermodesulfobacteriaceae bacterium]
MEVWRNKLLVMLGLLSVLWLSGIAGYMVLEEWSFLEAFYMTAISLTTVGYGEIHPLSDQGRIFTAILITSGVGFFFYALHVLAEVLLEGHLRGFMLRRRMEKAISKLTNHYIVCGYGRLGTTISKIFAERGYPVVIIENDASLAGELDRNGLLYVIGDATLDEVLIMAGINNAKGIICVLNSNSDNLYITLTARSMNEDLLIVSRATDPNVEKRMIQAGATKVLSPYEIGARRMAVAVLQPTVIEFLDLLLHSSELDLGLEQITVAPDSQLDGVSLMEADVRRKTGTTILAVKHPSGEMIMPLTPNHVFRGGDVVIAIGSRDGLNSLKSLAW